MYGITYNILEGEKGTTEQVIMTSILNQTVDFGILKTSLYFTTDILKILIINPKWENHKNKLTTKNPYAFIIKQ